MGALTAEYRWPVTDIRDTTEDDFDAVFELLTARSRAAFGFSAEQPAFLRQRWDNPATDNWVATDDGAIVGYASLDEGQDFVHAAVDPDVGDALIAHVEHQARTRGFQRVEVISVPEDVPLFSAVQRNGY